MRAIGFVERLREMFGRVAERHAGERLDDRPQQWIAIDEVADTAALLHAIAATMPPGATLTIRSPRAAAVEALVRAHAAHPCAPDTRDFHLTLAEPAASELARLSARLAPHEVCAHIIVSDGARSYLEAFRRDAGERVIWLDRTLPAATLDAFRAALGGANLRPGAA